MHLLVLNSEGKQVFWMDTSLLVLTARPIGCVKLEMRCVAVIAPATSNGDSGYIRVLPGFVWTNGEKKERKSLLRSTHKNKYLYVAHRRIRDLNVIENLKLASPCF